MHVLLSTYKAEQKRGHLGAKRREKRQMELGILKLFEDEGQKLIAAASVMYPKTVCPQVPVSSQKGHPQTNRSGLEEVKGGCDPKTKWSREEEEDSHEEDTQMTLSEVELARKKDHDIKSQDQDILRKLSQIQLVDIRRSEKKQALAMKSQDQPNQPAPQPDANQAEIQSFYTQQVVDHEQYRNESELEGQYYTQECDCDEGSCFCY
ncbi:hypothetical protein EYF80_060131 [Liparis tanakae]|uniref:Uncharacterized protein n=1 Tax=Liparis tanakae TaxID=230148 RepID=A0A4Z2EMC7_9TELE|nr:hypothetical protein EYF80_060131 [Liparis tanakae]